MRKTTIFIKNQSNTEFRKGFFTDYVFIENIEIKNELLTSLSIIYNTDYVQFTPNEIISLRDFFRRSSTAKYMLYYNGCKDTTHSYIKTPHKNSNDVLKAIESLLNDDDKSLYVISIKKA